MKTFKNYVPDFSSRVNDAILDFIVIEELVVIS